MPHSEGTLIAHKEGNQRFVATLAGLELDCRLCLAVVLAISLALTGGSRLELLIAALVFLWTARVPSRTARPTPRANGSRSPWAGDAAAVVDDGSRPDLPQARVRHPRPSFITPAANQPACQKYLELITEHVRAKRWDQAFEVLTGMRQLSIEPSVACFTALITAYDRTKRPEKALELFDTMQMEGVEPDVLAYNAVIS